MAENVPPADAPNAGTNPSDAPGNAYYNQQRALLTQLLREKQDNEAKLVKLDRAIFQKEGDYLEDTPLGNIITGFDNYTKNSSSAGARRGGNKSVDANRIFSSSSITYTQKAETPNDTAQSTPVATSAPTPISTNLMKGESASNQATPTSATSTSRNGAGQKKKKAGGDESETEGREAKKARTNFSAPRK